MVLTSSYRSGGAVGLALVLIGLSVQPASAQGKAPMPAEKNGRNAAVRPGKAYLGTDVVATVEGDKITRRELTYYWFQIQPDSANILGKTLADSFRRDRGAGHTYAITDTQIYATLYGEDRPELANILSSLIMNRLVAKVSERQGIAVTQTQAEAHAHELFEQFRAQRNVKYSDAEIMKMYKIPKDVFLQDMLYQLRVEKLVEADIAARNGHPLTADDWVLVRQLAAPIVPAKDAVDRRQKLAEAKTIILAMQQEVQGGKSIDEVARVHNGNMAAVTSGLRGPILRGTQPGAIESAIFHTKSGEMTQPIAGDYGWYLFKIESVGAAIPKTERAAAWQNIVTTEKVGTLARLYARAKVTSSITLPRIAPPSADPLNLDTAVTMPPAPPIKATN